MRNEAELAVGISEFANSNLVRFQAYVKKRYSDFIVDEIDLDGNVATITEVLFEDSIRNESKISKETEIEEILSEEALVERLLSELENLLTEDQAKEIVSLFSVDGEPFISNPIMEKSDRTKFHSTIRTLFNGKLVTDTVEDKIRVARKSITEIDRKRANLDKRNFQDPNKLPCVMFTLQKEFMETIEAIQIIAKKLYINPKDISVAGTKDKRAITTQFVTVRHLNPNKLNNITGMCNGKIRVSNVKRGEEPLKLGDLSGNRFTLVLRDVRGDFDDIEASVESLKSLGFINYYGLQRFGSMSVKSHHIGIKLLQGKYQEAINLVLDPREDESDGAAKEARRIWADTRDPKSAHDALPFRYNAERQILWHFHKQGNQTDLVGALLSISRDLRLMYVHSVQSLVWNRLVSERLKRFGMKPVVGDLVMGKDLPPTPISEESLPKYSIYDVVIPLPGYDVRSPTSHVGQMYKEIVEKEFELMNDDCFRPKSKALWDLPGAYRYVISKPKDVQWSSGNYSDPDAAIGRASALDVEGEFKAVLLSFSLPTSSYATMALREIMHSLY